MTTDSNNQTARCLAPEDIQRGMYVSMIKVIAEVLPFCWDMDPHAMITTPLSIAWLPPEDEVAPMKVLRVCLPFVLVKGVDGNQRTLDVRRYRLAQLSDQFGREAFYRRRSKKRNKREESKRRSSK